MHESHVTREAVERLKAEMPDLCMWVYAAKGINESSGVPDSTLSTIGSMRLIVEMLASEPKENILPTASQHRGWDAAIVARGIDAAKDMDEVDAMTARVKESIGRLNEAARQLEVAKALVEMKYAESMRQLEEIAALVLRGGYQGPGAAKELVVGIHEQVRTAARQQGLDAPRPDLESDDSDNSSVYSDISEDLEAGLSDPGMVISGDQADQALRALFTNIEIPPRPPGF